MMRTRYKLFVPIAVLLSLTTFLILRGAVVRNARIAGSAPAARPYAPIAPDDTCTVDGIAITNHGTANPLGFGSPAFWGNLIRHDIKHGKVISSRIIYNGGDASVACISPSGNRVAFLKKNLQIAVIDMNGGQETIIGALEAPDGADGDKIRLSSQRGLFNYGANNLAAYLQWITENGEDWIYYAGGFGGERSTYLRRVNVSTHQKELVVKFNREVTSFGLSADTTPNRGKFVTRTTDGGITAYDLSAGSGDLYGHTEVEGCGMSVFPDGLYFAANNFRHDSIKIYHMDGTVKAIFNINQWAKKGGDHTRSFWHLRCSVNSSEWVSACQSFDGSNSYTNVVLYNWSKHQQVQVTQNGPGAFDRAEGFWERGLPVNGFEMGFYSGKAPYTVHLKPRTSGGVWNWNFGDGSTTVGTVGIHKYTNPGDYMVTARQGKLRLTGHVTVDQRRPPTVVSVDMLDPTHLLAIFDEPVNAQGISASLQSHRRIRSFHPSEDGRRITFVLDGAIRRDDVLRLDGVVDRAQVPDRLKNPIVPVKYLSWPSNRTNLEFCWETAKGTNAVYDETSHLGKVCQLLKRGDADLDANGALSLRGGYFEAVEGWQGIYENCRLHNAFTLEATITPSVSNQGSTFRPAKVLSFSWANSENFWLGQIDDRLLFSLGTSEPDQNPETGTAVCILAAGQPNHIIVSYRPGFLVCYLNGAPVFQTSGVRTTFDKWIRARFSIGERRKPDDWLGKVEGIAIYSRWMEAAEARENFHRYQKLMGMRSILHGLEIEAKLIGRSHVPTAAEIIPYRDALVVDEYEVERVLKGSYSKKTIRVARWGLLNDRPAPPTSNQAGQISHLVVEPLHQHPELEQKYISDTLPDNFDLEVYTDARV